MKMDILNRLIDRQNQVDEKLNMFIEEHYLLTGEVITWKELREKHKACKAMKNWLHKPLNLNETIRDLNLIFRSITKDEYETLSREWIYNWFKSKAI